MHPGAGGCQARCTNLLRNFTCATVIYLQMKLIDYECCNVSRAPRHEVPWFNAGVHKVGVKTGALTSLMQQLAFIRCRLM